MNPYTRSVLDTEGGGTRQAGGGLALLWNVFGFLDFIVAVGLPLGFILHIYSIRRTLREGRAQRVENGRPEARMAAVAR